MKKVRDILERLWLDCNNVPDDGSVYDPIGNLLDRTTTQIKKLFHDIVPKEKGLCSGKDFDKLSDCEYALKTERNIGYDQAIKETHKEIDKL